jgi:predicted phage terminase large subunit-like protein
MKNRQELSAVELVELAKRRCQGRVEDLELYFETVRQFLPDMISKKPYFEDIYNKAIEYKIKYATVDVDAALKFSDIAKKTALVLAPDYFHYYLLYVEWNRVPEKKFYPPRMKALRVVVDDLQDLADGVIKLLTVSLPPRIGKSTLGIFFLTWLMGRYPDMANLMSGHSDTLTKGFYKEVLSILLDEEYLWGDVFPNTKIAATSAEDESICLNKQRRFPTLTCRASEGTLTGAVEVAKLLYVDDIIKDLEEALSPQRLQNKYNAYLNQLKDRKKDGAMELHIGTRWAVTDVIGKLKEQYADDPTVRFRVVPALDENGESNFDYPYGLGFSTAYYEDMKASIDPAEWNAKYMGDPQPREGLLFPMAELNFYDGTLPEGNPDVVAVCDVAFGGGDSLSSPIIYWYGDTGYVHEWIFHKGAKDVTIPLVVSAYHRNRIIKARFEANAGGDVYADKVREQLAEIGDRPYIFSKRADTKMGKMARIQRDAPDIKKMLYFRNDKKRGKDYEAAMNELMRYTIIATKQHDDAPDSLSMAITEHTSGSAAVKIFKRLF